MGGSSLATEVTLAAVTESGLSNKVQVFGVSDLSRDKAEMLLDPNSPLHLIIDKSGVEIGYHAGQTIISVLRRKSSGADYQVHLMEHSLLTKDDLELVRYFINNYGWLSR
ncbi:MAG: hypothetical protein F6K39_27440 [Okeania sp. SIO3B3]|nr:hypothetical protein [Okeania sp. SIO3B3]